MRLFPRFVLAFVLVAFVSVLASGWLSEQAARGRIRPQTLTPPALKTEPQTRRPGQGPPQEAIRPLLAGLRISQIVAASIALVIALAIGSLLALRLVQPIRNLINLNRRYLLGERSLRYSGKGRDEVHELGLTFNRMAEQIGKEQQQQRQLVADVAHDLRTPLTVIKGELEYIQDGITEPTPQVIQRLSEEVDLLVRLVGDLRLLSLADSDGLEFHHTLLDFTALTRDAAQAFTHIANNKGCHLSVSGPSVLVRVDRERMQQVLYNLLDNALKHTQPNTEIKCHIQSSPDTLTLSIRDHGPRLADTDLERVFQRFYRTDSARTRSDGSSGLGLAIVKTLVEAHGGQVRAENHPERGAVLTVVLPR
jgi:two-component system, OmpR family, sensor histidine kinase BaeS